MWGGVRREEAHPNREPELRELLECEICGARVNANHGKANLFAVWLHDRMLRMNLALDLGIDIFSAEMMSSGVFGCWEA
jgi:hypothetical protein